MRVLEAARLRERWLAGMRRRIVPVVSAAALFFAAGVVFEAFGFQRPEARRDGRVPFQKRGEASDAHRRTGGFSLSSGSTNAWELPLFSFFSDRRRGAARGGEDGAFVAAKDKLAIVVAGDKTGTGFLLRDGGRVFLLTNAHVVRGAPAVEATRLDGVPLRLGDFEVAHDRDLARFEVDSDLPAFVAETRTPDIGAPIVVLGNSDGRGVVTEIRGRVLGVGPQEIEVDAGFVVGNSGSPVLNRAGRVLAIASYLRDCRDDSDWSKTGTRFNGIRRFAVRPRGILWRRPTSP